MEALRKGMNFIPLPPSYGLNSTSTTGMALTLNNPQRLIYHLTKTPEAIHPKYVFLLTTSFKSFSSNMLLGTINPDKP